MKIPIILFAEKDKLLAIKVATKLQFKALQWETQKFANSETLVRIPESIRSKKVYIFFSTISPINESFFELFVAIDAINRCLPNSITLIAPFLGYGRQEQKTNFREPISTALIAHLLEATGINKIVTIDPHAPSSIGFYRIPLEIVSFQKHLLIHVFRAHLENYVLAFPDFQAQKKAQKWSKLLQKKTVIFSKMRTGINQIEMKLLFGNPQNKNVILVDDMIDTGSTICQAIKFLRSLGARNIYVLATHGIFSGDALENLAQLHKEGHLTKVVISDSYPSFFHSKYSFLEIVSLADLLAALLGSDNDGTSFSSIFKNVDQELIKLANEK